MDVLGEQPLHRDGAGPLEPEDRRAALVPVDDPADEVDLPDTDRAGLHGDIQPRQRRPHRCPGRRELQLGDHGGRELLEQLDLVGRPVPGGRVVHGQDADDVAGIGDERRLRIGADLSRGDRRQVGDLLVLRRVGDGQRAALAHGDGRERAGQQRRPPDDARRQTETADHGVLIGEQGDLGVADPEQTSGETRQSVVGGRARHLDQESAGGGDAVLILERVDLCGPGAIGRRHARPPPCPSLERPGRGLSGTMLTRRTARRRQSGPERSPAAPPVG